MLILRGSQPLKRRHRAAADLVSTLARAGDACMASLGRQHRYDQFQRDDPPLLRSARPMHTAPRLQPRARASGARVRLDASREQLSDGMLPGTFPRRPATARTYLCARHVPDLAFFARKAAVEASASSRARCQLAREAAHLCIRRNKKKYSEEHTHTPPRSNTL